MPTRLTKKRKINDLINNAPTKKARVNHMKELAKKYITMYEKCENKKSCYFNDYYKTKKMIYPWLSKETLRWHVRKYLDNKENQTPPKIAQKISSNVLNSVAKYKLVFIETKDVVETTMALDNYRHACDSGRGAVILSVARGKVRHLEKDFFCFIILTRLLRSIFSVLIRL